MPLNGARKSCSEQTDACIVSFGNYVAHPMKAARPLAESAIRVKSSFLFSYLEIKMELVAPWSSQHLFLVMHQYNDSDENQLADARIQKDQPFFPASTNTYISAVSLRISLFGNNSGSGYAYRYLPEHWYIAADVPDQNQSQSEELVRPTTFTDTRVGVASFDFINPSNQTISLGVLKNFSGESLANEVNAARFTEVLATELNEYKLNRDAKIRFVSDQETSGAMLVYQLQLDDDPTKYIQGGGLGRNGLATLRGAIDEFPKEGLKPTKDNPMTDPEFTQALVDHVTTFSKPDNGRPDIFQIRLRFAKKNCPMESMQYSAGSLGFPGFEETSIRHYSTPDAHSFADLVPER